MVEIFGINRRSTWVEKWLTQQTEAFGGAVIFEANVLIGRSDAQPYGCPII